MFFLYPPDSDSPARAPRNLLLRQKTTSAVLCVSLVSALSPPQLCLPPPIFQQREFRNCLIILHAITRNTPENSRVKLRDTLQDNNKLPLIWL